MNFEGGENCVVETAFLYKGCHKRDGGFVLTLSEPLCLETTFHTSSPAPDVLGCFFFKLKIRFLIFYNPKRCLYRAAQTFYEF